MPAHARVELDASHIMIMSAHRAWSFEAFDTKCVQGVLATVSEKEEWAVSSGKWEGSSEKWAVESEKWEVTRSEKWAVSSDGAKLNEQEE